ncbi:MAG: hypothetical protein AB8B95_12020 [Pseudohongiellaceae bacterium]
MTTIATRKVNRIDRGKETFGKLDENAPLLSKHKVTPSRENLDHAHSKSQKPAARRGQIIDVLV